MNAICQPRDNSIPLCFTMTCQAPEQRETWVNYSTYVGLWHWWLGRSGDSRAFASITQSHYLV